MTAPPTPRLGTSWRRFLAVAAFCAAPTLLTILALPIYGPPMDDAAIVPPIFAAVYVTPGLCLLVFAGGLVTAWLHEDPSKRAAWRATAIAAAWSFGVFAALLGWLFVVSLASLP